MRNLLSVIHFATTMRRVARQFLLAAVCIVAVGSVRAEGKVFTWYGYGKDNKWTTKANWKDASNQQGVPGVEDTAIIASGGPSFTESIVVSNLYISFRTTFTALPLPGATTAATIAANPTVVKVNGEFRITGATTVTVSNDRISGAAVKFDVGSFYMDETATITANEKGFRWYCPVDALVSHTTTVYNKYTGTNEVWGTRALGPAAYYLRPNYYGAGHGTEGKHPTTGATEEGYGDEYGLKYAPVCPGSSGNGNIVADILCIWGGGTIWIVSHGDFIQNGTMTANSKANSNQDGASGGSIWLAAKSFTFGANASLEAKSIPGGASKDVSSAGGRISLAQNVTDAQLAQLLAGEEPSELTYADEITLVSASASGGVSGDPRNGTLTTVQGPQENQTVTVQSSGVLATGTLPAYGTFPYRIGSTQTFTAPAYGFDPANDCIRYECLGYIVSNETAEVASGTATSVDVTIGQVPQSVTWRWGVPERRTIVRKPANGALRLGGEILAGDAIQWLKSGVPASVEVVPDSGYEFLCWEGNAPYGAARTNPMNFTAWLIYDVTPVLRTAGDEPTERTWSGTGLWTDAANWTPANLPGPGDTLLIASGVCTVSNGLVAAAVTVSPTATLKVGTAGDVNPYLTVSGNLTVSGVPASGKATDWPKLNLGFAPRMTGNGAISVGGDFTIAGEAVVTVCGGPTNAVFSHASGATALTVGKTLAITNTASLCLESDYMTGGSVKIAAKTVILGEAAKIDAAGRGYRWDDTTAPETAPGFPGVGTGGYAGGSYGGKGQERNDRLSKDPNGFANAPVYPGSPSGAAPYPNFYPGGLVRIHAREMTVDGTVTASATRGEPQFGSKGGPSGGGIWLTADKYAFGPNAVLTAKGGEGGSSVGAGGGGRIAVGFRLTAAQIDELSRTGEWTGYRPKRARDEAAFRAELGNAEMTIDLHTQPSADNVYDAPGTFTFVDGRAPGLSVLIR